MGAPLCWPSRCCRWGRAASAAVLNAPAVPITQVLTVQPIVVCGDATLSSCASTAGLAAYETMANAIYSQSGIGVAFAPLKSFVDPSYLSVKVDNTLAGIFDSAHDLVRLPGHGQAADPNTLNVYFVNRILATSNGVLTGAPTYGYGLVGGNGAIVATAPDASNHVASVDTLAHELGHNLGLSHTNGLTGTLAQYDTIYNLMNTSTRTVPVDTVSGHALHVQPGEGHDAVAQDEPWRQRGREHAGADQCGRGAEGHAADRDRHPGQYDGAEHQRQYRHAERAVDGRLARPLRSCNSTRRPTCCSRSNWQRSSRRRSLRS